MATRQALWAGTLPVFGGGLALYQMMSLMPGPAGSRQLNLSLSVPIVDSEALPVPAVPRRPDRQNSGRADQTKRSASRLERTGAGPVMATPAPV